MASQVEEHSSSHSCDTELSTDVDKGKVCQRFFCNLYVVFISADKRHMWDGYTWAR